MERNPWHWHLAGKKSVLTEIDPSRSWERNHQGGDKNHFRNHGGWMDVYLEKTDLPRIDPSRSALAVVEKKFGSGQSTAVCTPLSGTSNWGVRVVIARNPRCT